MSPLCATAVLISSHQPHNISWRVEIPYSEILLTIQVRITHIFLDP